MTVDKVTENRCRRAARRRGYRLVKSRMRDSGAPTFERYWIHDVVGHTLQPKRSERKDEVALGGKWGATIEEVEAYLTRD